MRQKMNSGTRLGPCKIHEQLGAGGIGEVYRAREMRPDLSVAIKVLPEHLADDPPTVPYGMEIDRSKDWKLL